MPELPEWVTKHLESVKKVIGVIIRIAGGLGAWIVAKIQVPEQIERYTAIPIVATVCLAWLIPRFTLKQAWSLIAGSFFLSVVLGAYYFTVAGNYVVQTKDGTRFVRGDLREGVPEKMMQLDLTEREYLFASSKDPDLVWTAESVGKATTIIAAWYGAFVLTFTFGLFAAIEVLTHKDAMQRRESRAKGKSID